MHYEYLASMTLVKDELVLTSERGRIYALDIHTRAVRRMKAKKPNKPVYAGAFVYGRTRTRSQMIDGRARKSSGHAVALEQWEVLIKNHHPGYITWEEYLENQKQMAANLTCE
jgi:hypothetical protein